MLTNFLLYDIFCLQTLLCCAADVLEGKGLVQIAITVTELVRFHGPKSPVHSLSTII